MCSGIVTSKNYFTDYFISKGKYLHNDEVLICNVLLSSFILFIIIFDPTTRKQLHMNYLILQYFVTPH